ncbi:TNT domain-containing protein [Nocardia sp. NPDC057030]|uniref:TNT domain-containing protein n=1 Tax=unclassified Nocardia TaxID=2637762 RepID=UPI003636D2F9
MSKLEVDPKVYYQAAINCFDAAAALNDSFKYVFGELNSCGQMAGRDEDGRAWAAAYDESARDAVSFFDQTFSTLRAYGTALNDLGFEHAKSDAALKGTAQPERPADSASTVTFGPYALPASAAGGTPQGLAKTSIEVLDAINCPLPDGDTDTLTKAADAWDRLGTIYQNTNAKDKITIAAGLFDDVTSKDAVQVREDLKTLETSIGQLLTTCTQISKTCLDYKESIVELRNEIKGFIESIIEEAALNVAVIVIASCLTGVGGLIAGAKAAESARKWAVKIKEAVTAWRARKILQLKGLAADAKAAMAKGKQAVKDLYERLRNKLSPKLGAKKTYPSGESLTDAEYVAKYGSPGNWKYPGADYAVPGTKVDVDLPAGTKIDRYGSEYGSWLSPEGTPLTARSLPPDTLATKAYNTYEVAPGARLPPGWSIEQSKVATWFGEEGGGIQYRILKSKSPEVDGSVQDLIDCGYLIP